MTVSTVHPIAILALGAAAAFLALVGAAGEPPKTVGARLAAWLVRLVSVGLFAVAAGLPAAAPNCFPSPALRFALVASAAFIFFWERWTDIGRFLARSAEE